MIEIIGCFLVSIGIFLVIKSPFIAEMENDKFFLWGVVLGIVLTTIGVILI